jgi:serine/threonine protein kinase
MTQSPQPTLTQLTEKGILSPEDAAKVQATLDSSELATSAKELADQLVQLNKLTPYQAKLLAAGDLKDLVLGNYVLLDQLGEGGMGRVFKARHRGMDRIVAIKMLLPEKLGSKSGLKRFSQEVKAAARLTHPNIVTAFDADVDGEVPYLVMEYVDGEDLQSILAKRGRLPIDEAVDYIRQTARGLEHAHSVGIVHRDIKPGNLLVDKQGVVHILDMGVAQLRPQMQDDSAPADIHTQITRDGAVIGTVDFMAPEQAASARRADERSDIYSLGCTLYFLLTNEPVYRAESVVDRLIAHRQRPIPSLRVARPDVSPALDAVFHRMVAKEPAERFASISELLAALDAVGQSPGSMKTTVEHAAQATHDSGGIDWVDDDKRHTAKGASPSSPRHFGPTTLALLLLGVVFLVVMALYASDGFAGLSTLQVQLTEPDALVLVIDRAINQAAASEFASQRDVTFRLPAGDYQVQVIKNGSETVSLNVELRAWRRTRVNVELSPSEPSNNFIRDLAP